MDLEQAARQAAKTIRAMPPGTRWFVACDTDADGLCAAGVMALALRRIGHGVQLRPSRQKDEAAYRALAEAVCDGYLLLDKGSSHLHVLADVHHETGRPVVVIDHHPVPSPPPPQVRLVNPRAAGLDGSRDASASTTAAAVALALSEANLDLAGTAVAGAVGDWQHHGGWQGWNRALIDRATAAGHLERRRQPALVGLDLADALTHTEPPTPGMDRAAAAAFVDGLGLRAHDTEQLDREAQSRLLSAWALHHLSHGSDPGVIDALTQEALWDRRMGTGIRRIFRLMDACGRTGAAATGLAFLMGDRQADVEGCFDGYAQALATSLDRLRREGTQPRQACQVAWTQDPGLTGMVGGLGMTHVLDDVVRPIVVLAPRPEGDVQVSTRGTHEAVHRGMDLGKAVHDAAARVGRDGGGHPLAAGTVVAAADVDAFLAALDEALLQQDFLAATL